MILDLISESPVMRADRVHTASASWMRGKYEFIRRGFAGRGGVVGALRCGVHAVSDAATRPLRPVTSQHCIRVHTCTEYSCTVQSYSTAKYRYRTSVSMEDQRGARAYPRNQAEYLKYRCQNRTGAAIVKIEFLMKSPSQYDDLCRRCRRTCLPELRRGRSC